MKQGLLIAFLLCIGLLARDSAAADSTRLIVFPLDNQSEDDALAWLGDGLAVALSDELRVPGVEAIGWEERSRLAKSVDLPSNAQLSRASMIRIAQKAGADYMIFGTVSGEEKAVEIVLRVLDMKKLRMGGDISGSGSLASLPQLENELSYLILSHTGLDAPFSREEFQERTRTIPNQAFSWYVESLMASDPDARATLLQKAVNVYPFFPQALFRLGSYYFRNGDYENAIKNLEPALKGPQTLIETQFMLGACYFGRSRYDDAAKAYEAALVRSRRAEILNNLGAVYVRKGDYAAAIDDLTDARGQARSDSTISLNLAIALHLAGDAGAGLDLLEELVKLFPNQGLVRYLYGKALSGKGEQGGAAAAFEQARRLGADPEKLDREDPKQWVRIFRTLVRS